MSAQGFTEGIAVLVNEALIVLLSRAVIGIRICDAGESQGCESCGGKGEMTHSYSSLSVHSASIEG